MFYNRRHHVIKRCLLGHVQRLIGLITPRLSSAAPAESVVLELS